MTNNQIIRNEAARLDPATLHAIATAHHTPDEIAAIAAACKTTDENGNEQPATVADVEIMLAADELHTFDHWKKEGKSVKKGEKHLVCCYLWKYTTKPSKEQREKAAAEGKEAAPDPHYYPTKSHLFSCLQVESNKPAPAGRFGSTAAIIEYNKKLAAERKAAKAAAEKAKAEATAPIITEEHHELPELVHVDPLPTKKATKRTAKKAPAKKAETKPTGPDIRSFIFYKFRVGSPCPRTRFADCRIGLFRFQLIRQPHPAFCVAVKAEQHDAELCHRLLPSVYFFGGHFRA